MFSSSSSLSVVLVCGYLILQQDAMALSMVGRSNVIGGNASFRNHPFVLYAENVNGVNGLNGDANEISPVTFREAELIGLRLMQEAKFEDAISMFNQGMKLPGSKKDVIRKQSISGPSPGVFIFINFILSLHIVINLSKIVQRIFLFSVGGSAGGREGGEVMTLDEFEYQAAHYNIACAHAKLGNIPEAVASLSKAIDFGFNNLDTIRADPDLRSIQGAPEFKALLNKHDSKSFNPFSFFGKGK